MPDSRDTGGDDEAEDDGGPPAPAPNADQDQDRDYDSDRHDVPEEDKEDHRDDEPPGRDPPAVESGQLTAHEVRIVVEEIATTVAAVVVVGLVLFAVSGVWPPLVAVESGSMEPHMYKGDLVFIVEDGRYAPGEAIDGVVTYRNGDDTGYWSFGNHGNVVVFRPHVESGQDRFRGNGGTPIIHRARFYVEKGENWVEEADGRYLGAVDSCSEIDTCPAPHAGFITKGDNNAVYDQVAGRSTVVKREWIRGVAKVRVPWLGCIRLQLSSDSCFD